MDPQFWGLMAALEPPLESIDLLLRRLHVERAEEEGNERRWAILEDLLPPGFLPQQLQPHGLALALLQHCASHKSDGWEDLLQLSLDLVRLVGLKPAQVCLGVSWHDQAFFHCGLG